MSRLQFQNLHLHLPRLGIDHLGTLKSKVYSLLFLDLYYFMVFVVIVFVMIDLVKPRILKHVSYRIQGQRKH